MGTRFYQMSVNLYVVFSKPMHIIQPYYNNSPSLKESKQINMVSLAQIA